MLVAVLLRVIMFNPYAIHHPDEAFQYLEQAHRLAFGYGIVPWEYRDGIRNWVIPLLLTPPMALGGAIAPGSNLYLILARALFALVNLAPLPAAWFLGARHSRQAAIVAPAVTAVWIECIFFSVSVLSESIATSCFMVAAALLYTRSSLRSAAVAGALLTFAAIVRFQYVPAIAVFALACAGRDSRRWAGLIAGALPVLLAGAVADAAMGLVPYSWVLNNIRLNLVANRMSEFGGLSPWVYLASVFSCWLAGIVIIPLLAALVWREYRALLLAAAVNLVFHQFIGHREYRFIWLTLQIVLLVAAVGSTRAVAETYFGRRFDDPGGSKATVVLIAIWAAASLGLSLTYTYRVAWRDSGVAPWLAAEAARDPRVCGIAVEPSRYWLFGAWAIHSRKPVFLPELSGARTLTGPGSLAGAYNASVSWEGAAPGYRPIRCVEGPDRRTCLYMRPGACSMMPEDGRYLAQQRLIRLNR